MEGQPTAVIQLLCVCSSHTHLVHSFHLVCQYVGGLCVNQLAAHPLCAVVADLPQIVVQLLVIAIAYHTEYLIMVDQLACADNGNFLNRRTSHCHCHSQFLMIFNVRMYVVRTYVCAVIALLNMGNIVPTYSMHVRTYVVHTSCIHG